MPDTKSPGDEPEPTGSSGPKKMIMTAVLVVVLVGVGYVLGGKLGGGDGAAAEGPADSAAEEAEEDHEAPHVATVVDLDPVNVNLAEGHYLRVAISLGLATAGGSHGGEVEFAGAAASDVVLHTFSGREMAELSTTAGREAARQELAEGLAEHYGDEVVTVYFTEFVMQ